MFLLISMHACRQNTTSIVPNPPPKYTLLTPYFDICPLVCIMVQSWNRFLEDSATSRLFEEMVTSFAIHHVYPISVCQFQLKNANTYDRLLSPSFLKLSMVFNISFRPPEASTSFPPILILTFSLAFALSSRLSSK